MNDTLHGRFLRGLSVAPDRTAISVGGTAVSYAQAHETALGWAATLLDRLDEPPRAVGVLANKSIEAYVGTLAALYTGAAVVPLHPDYPAGRTRQALTAAGVSALVVDDRGAVRVPGIERPDLPVLGPGHLRAGAALDAPRPVHPDDPAYVLFTSGSTGVPKGVPIKHSALTHYFGLLDERYDFTPEDVFSQTFDLTFDCAMFDLFCAWGAGAALLGVPLAGYRALPRFAAEHGMTVWFSVPSAISMIRKAGGLTAGALPGLRWSFFAGEAFRAADAADWAAAAPHSPVENLYGPTELTITIAGHRWMPDSAPRSTNGIVPIGPVHPGHDWVLLDAAGVPDDDAGDGELAITGPQMCTGYLDPQDDEGRFLKHDGRTWYRTGDRVRRWPDGELSYLGRADDQVQIGGWRVELAEVGNAVRACPGVTDAAAVAPLVDDEPRLFVFYTGEELTAGQLARHLRDSLPSGILPKHYRHLDELPLNANRKVDRTALRQRAAALLAEPAGVPVSSGRPSGELQ